MNYITPKNTALALGIISAIELTYFLIKKLIPCKKKKTQVLFFSATHNNDWREHKRHTECEQQNCYCHNYHRVLQNILRVDKQLDICVYLITALDLTVAIKYAHVRGVKVRVILDFEMSQSSGSKIEMFQKAGIPVRYRKTEFLMHHKFCLIDDMLMTGSLNFTMNAFAGNWDNVLCTNEPVLVKQFRDEFERIWNDFA